MKLLFIITILASLLSCTKKEADVNFSIRVKDNKNISVPNAEVFINNKLIGETNKDGKINYKSSYIKNSSLQIEITKKSDDDYFSPYFEKVSLSDNNDQSQSITAVLYSVPKSKNTEIAKKPEIESTTNKEIENVKPTSKTAETPIKDTNLEEKYKKEDKKENQPHIVSISTTFNKSPVSDVEVYLQTNAKYIFVCR